VEELEVLTEAVVAFYGRSQNYKKRLLALSCLSPSVGPAVRMEQLGFHWTDFLKFGCMSICQKYVDKIKV
jgi:hypothetical protein